MTKLKKCPNSHYTLRDICPICNEKTQSAHYKFIKIRPVNKQKPSEQEVIIKEQQEGVLIKKPIENIVEKLRKIAERVNENKKRKSLDARTMKKTFYEQYEKRARRAGISIRK